MPPSGYLRQLEQLFRQRRSHSPPKMPPIPEVIIDFQQARDAFLHFLAKQASLIRHQPTPESVQEARTNLQDQSYRVLQELITASLYMSADAPDHPITITKPFGFYDIEVPARCTRLQKVVPLLAKRLGLNAKCDMCVHHALMSIVEDLGF
jgi:hypothetical protein